VKPEFIVHLRHNWPLAVVVVGLFLYIPFVLIRGVFFTNQGNIIRSIEPARYWHWVRLFLALFLFCLVALVGSYFLSRH
jgi:phosphate starvation-inducible membrane PsiE